MLRKPSSRKGTMPNSTAFWRITTVGARSLIRARMASLTVSNSLVAELVAVVAHDKGLRRTLVASGRRELERFKSFPREKFLLDRIAELTGR
jgi:hypothetical protein